MAAQGGNKFLRIDTDRKPYLASRRRLRRDSVDGMLRIAGLEGQHFETVPGKNFLRTG